MRNLKKITFSTVLALSIFGCTCLSNNFSFFAEEVSVHKENIEDKNLAGSKIITDDNENKPEEITDTVKKTLNDDKITFNKNSESDKTNEIETKNLKNKEEKIDQELKKALRQAGVKEILKHPFMIAFDTSFSALCGYVIGSLPPFCLLPYSQVVLSTFASVSSLILKVTDYYESGVEKKANQI